MSNADLSRVRELRLMARLYEERGEHERARKVLEWTRSADKLPIGEDEEANENLESLLPKAPERPS